MPKTKRSRLQKAQSAGNLGLLNTGNKENCSTEVVPATLHTLAATGLKMTCHKVCGKEYECQHHLEVRKNARVKPRTDEELKEDFNMESL